jgi:single-strand DNA-binding protein
MELEVKIYSIGETQNVTDTFSKREFIVETQEQYKQHLQLQVVKDKCSVLDGYKVGQDVKVSLNLKGRLWTNKEGKEVAFNTLECWRIESVTNANNVEVNAPEPIGAEDDGMPF